MQSQLNEVRCTPTSLRSIRDAVQSHGGSWAFKHIHTLVKDTSLELNRSHGVRKLEIDGIYRPESYKDAYNDVSDLKVSVGGEIVPMGVLVSCSLGRVLLADIFWPSRNACLQMVLVDTKIALYTCRGWQAKCSEKLACQISSSATHYYVSWNCRAKQEYRLAHVEGTSAGRYLEGIQAELPEQQDLTIAQWMVRDDWDATVIERKRASVRPKTESQSGLLERTILGLMGRLHPGNFR
jgi:hypothetical protein